MTTKVVFTKDAEILEMKLKQYTQNATWIDKAIAGTVGALPASEMWYIHDGMLDYTVAGAYIVDYMFKSTSSEKYCREEITWNAYDVDPWTGDAITKAFSTDAPKTHKDVAVTVDGNSIVDLRSVEIRINKTYLKPDGDKAAGSYYHKYPYLVKIDIEIDLEYLTQDADHFIDLESESVDPFTVTVDVGTKTLTATNMKIKKKTLNKRVVPEKGLKWYKYTCEIGGACVLSTA